MASAHVTRLVHSLAHRVETVEGLQDDIEQTLSVHDMKLAKIPEAVKQAKKQLDELATKSKEMQDLYDSTKSLYDALKQHNVPRRLQDLEESTSRITSNANSIWTIENDIKVMRYRLQDLEEMKDHTTDFHLRKGILKHLNDELESTERQNRGRSDGTERRNRDSMTSTAGTDLDPQALTAMDIAEKIPGIETRIAEMEWLEQRIKNLEEERLNTSAPTDTTSDEEDEAMEQIEAKLDNVEFMVYCLADSIEAQNQTLQAAMERMTSCDLEGHDKATSDVSTKKVQSEVRKAVEFAAWQIKLEEQMDGLKETLATCVTDVQKVVTWTEEADAEFASDDDELKETVATCATEIAKLRGEMQWVHADTSSLKTDMQKVVTWIEECDAESDSDGDDSEPDNGDDESDDENEDLAELRGLLEENNKKMDEMKLQFQEHMEMLIKDREHDRSIMFLIVTIFVCILSYLFL